MLWETLKIGDFVKLVVLPPEFHQPGFYIHKDTLRVYKLILGRNKPLRIKEIKDGIPWTEIREKRAGRTYYHCLALNHDGLKLVEKRTRKK